MITQKAGGIMDRENNIKILLSSIFAGLCIGIGGACFLSIDNKIIGSFMFSLGLLTICTNQFSLFTGKVCYARTINDFINLIWIWFGNFMGCALVGFTLHLVKPQLIQKATEMCNAKLSEGLLVIPLGIMCNILIFFAVDGFKRIDNNIAKTILLIMCVMAFILCGFEHCIANMFYFTVADCVNPIIYLLLNTLGNAIGGLAISFMYETVKL